MEKFLFFKMGKFHEKRKKKILAQKISFPQKPHKKSLNCIFVILRKVLENFFLNFQEKFFSRKFV